MVDVCIIGAGIAGCACARYLSLYNLDVLVLEKGADIAMGATRANSGIVHGGYDPKPGTKKARFNVEGSRMYPQLACDLGFEFKNNGSLVVAFSEAERPQLEELLARGLENGVKGLEILESDELHRHEPNLSQEAVAALWVPTGGIVDPYGACLAFAENAAVNGVDFEFEAKVERLERMDDGWRVSATRAGESFVVEAKTVVNAAGVDAGAFHNQVSARSLDITPRAGEYVLLDNVWGGAFTSTVFQVPTDKGKGVLVTPTVEGNLLVGPNANARLTSSDTYTTQEGLDEIVAQARRTWPELPVYDAITNFAGLRASCLSDPDFHIGEPEDAADFFDIVGFDSPGLTAAPAVGKHVARLVAEKLGAEESPQAVSTRVAPGRIKDMGVEELERRIAEDPAWGRVVCRCERVSEAEIVAALRSPVPARTTDAVKWRTRAGMGRCQAGFCLPIVAEIMARELGIDIAEVTKLGAGSRLSVGHRGCLDDVPHVNMEGGRQ